jgi:hypothetical protein
MSNTCQVNNRVICRSRLFATSIGQFGGGDDQQLVWRPCGLENGLEGMILL